MTKFAERLNAYRLRNGHSQAEFAGMLGVSPGTVANWETGKFKPPVGKLKKIAETLGYSVEFLIGQEAGPDQAPSQIQTAIRETVAQYPGPPPGGGRRPVQRLSVNLQLDLFFDGENWEACSVSFARPEKPR